MLQLNRCRVIPLVLTFNSQFALCIDELCKLICIIFFHQIIMLKQFIVCFFIISIYILTSQKFEILEFAKIFSQHSDFVINSCRQLTMNMMWSGHAWKVPFSIIKTQYVRNARCQLLNIANCVRGSLNIWTAWNNLRWINLLNVLKAFN